MGQAGKSGKGTSGKGTSGKGDKGSGKGDKGKGSGKGDKGGKGKDTKNAKEADKREAKGNKKAGNKTSSMVSSGICACVVIVYSLVIGFLGGKAVKAVGDNPELLSALAASASASDIRVKKNVQEMDYGLKELTQIYPKSYNYINENDNTTRHLGIMAQDLKNIMPELVVDVDINNATDFKERIPSNMSKIYAIKYQELVPVLINAIKELKDEIDTLKQKM